MLHCTIITVLLVTVAVLSAQGRDVFSDYVVVAGGFASEGGTTNTVQFFDVYHNRWIIEDQLPPRDPAMAFTTRHILLPFPAVSFMSDPDAGFHIFSGHLRHHYMKAGGMHSHYEVYTPNAYRAWFPFPNILNMPTSGACSAELNGVSYLIGGQPTGRQIAAFDQGAWTVTQAVLPAGRLGCGAAASTRLQLIYICGFIILPLAMAKSCLSYNPSSGGLVEINRMKTGRTGNFLVYFDDHLFAVGGTVESGAAEKYSINTNVWSDLPASMDIARKFSNAVFDNERFIYLVGGGVFPPSGTHDITKKFERFDVLAESWSTLPELPVGRIQSGVVYHHGSE